MVITSFTTSLATTLTPPPPHLHYTSTSPPPHLHTLPHLTSPHLTPCHPSSPHLTPPHPPPHLTSAHPWLQVQRTTATIKHGDPDESGTLLRKTATTSGEDSDFVCERRSGGLDNGTRVTVLDERKVRRTVMCFVDDMDETNAFGRGWIKKDYLEDFETYDNSEDCHSCSEVPAQEDSQALPPPEHQCDWREAVCGHCPRMWRICAPDNNPSKGCGAEWGCGTDHVCTPEWSGSALAS